MQMSHTFVVSLQCTSKLILHYWASSFSPPSPVTSTHFSNGFLMTNLPWKGQHENNKCPFFICWTGKSHKMLVGLNASTWSKEKIILNLVTHFTCKMSSHWTLLLHKILPALYHSYKPNVYCFSQITFLLPDFTIEVYPHFSQWLWNLNVFHCQMVKMVSCTKNNYLNDGKSAGETLCPRWSSQFQNSSHERIILTHNVASWHHSLKNPLVLSKLLPRRCHCSTYFHISESTKHGILRKLLPFVRPI